jgi:hypothetical protein
LKTREVENDLAIPAGLEPATRGVETSLIARRSLLSLNSLASPLWLVRGFFRGFGVHLDQPASVKALDLALLMDERYQAMAEPPKPWDVEVEPLGVKLEFWNPARAEREFLRAFKKLGKRK